MPSEYITKKTGRLLRLIRSRERALAQVEIADDRMWTAFHDMVAAGGRAHARPTHHYEPYKNRTWWLFYATGDGFTFDWVDDPTPPLNPEIGQRLYAAERRTRVVCPRLRKINAAIAVELGFELDYANSNLLR